MDRIKKEVLFFALITILLFSLFLSLLSFYGVDFFLGMSYFIWLIFLIPLIPLVFCLRAYQKLGYARAIVENYILKIKVSTSQEKDIILKDKDRVKESYTYVSYFGILSDSELIKFNQDGISLKGVLIEKDYIVLSFGDKRTLREIRLLKPDLDSKSLDVITKRFFYETGIKPHINN